MENKIIDWLKQNKPAEKDYWTVYAIRGQSKEYPFELGELTHKSIQSFDDNELEDNDYELDGVCAITLGSYTDEEIEEVAKLIIKYDCEHIALLESTPYKNGNDYKETILQNPKVISILK